MHSKLFKFFKATVISVIVAFLFVAIIIVIYNSAIKKDFETVAWLLQIVAVKDVEEQKIEPVFIETEKILAVEPSISSEYARLIIPKINVNLPMYQGESLDILKNGIGHHLDTYFPGEGGSILCMGHNYKKYLQRLPEVEIGDIIRVEADYGTFEYTVYDTKVVHETNVEAAPIQDEEEIFMLYTCYPTYGLGHATQRLIVYAR